jgi:Fur family transcriptional regulator, ferric uptake regulator
MNFSPKKTAKKSPDVIFNQYLKENGIHYSEQRHSILHIFLKSKKHLTTAELYELVREKHPKVGYATVYRAMKVICKSGLGEEIDFGDGVKRYEHKYGHKHHDHLICLRCGKCIEVVNLAIEALQRELAREHAFTIKSHNMQIFGVCKECKAKRSRSTVLCNSAKK